MVEAVIVVVVVVVVYKVTWPFKLK